MKYYLGKNNKGRAIFASEPIKVGEIIMECPVIVLDKFQTKIVRQTFLDNYVFDWPDNNEYKTLKSWSASAIVLGYGSLINHSINPNCNWSTNIDTKKVIFIATTNIVKDEEIVFNYHWSSKKQKKLGLI